MNGPSWMKCPGTEEPAVFVGRVKPHAWYERNRLMGLCSFCGRRARLRRDMTIGQHAFRRGDQPGYFIGFSDDAGPYELGGVVHWMWTPVKP